MCRAICTYSPDACDAEYCGAHCEYASTFKVIDRLTYKVCGQHTRHSTSIALLLRLNCFCWIYCGSTVIIKGTVQRNLRGVSSGVNRYAFL